MRNVNSGRIGASKKIPSQRATRGRVQRMVPNGKRYSTPQTRNRTTPRKPDVARILQSYCILSRPKGNAAHIGKRATYTISVMKRYAGMLRHMRPPTMPLRCPQSLNMYHRLVDTLSPLYRPSARRMLPQNRHRMTRRHVAIFCQVIMQTRHSPNYRRSRRRIATRHNATLSR